MDSYKKKFDRFFKARLAHDKWKQEKLENKKINLSHHALLRVRITEERSRTVASIREKQTSLIEKKKRQKYAVMRETYLLNSKINIH